MMSSATDTNKEFLIISMDKPSKHMSSNSITEDLMFDGHKLETELKGARSPGAPVLPMPLYFSWGPRSL